MSDFRVKLKCFLFTLTRMEAIEMQTLSSEDQRHLENQTEGERSNEKPTVWRLMTSVLKVLWKFCTTVYDIASDFLQGKHPFLVDSSKNICLLVKMENTCFHYYSSIFEFKVGNLPTCTWLFSCLEKAIHMYKMLLYAPNCLDF